MNTTWRVTEEHGFLRAAKALQRGDGDDRHAHAGHAKVGDPHARHADLEQLPAAAEEPDKLRRETFCGQKADQVEACGEFKRYFDSLCHAQRFAGAVIVTNDGLRRFAHGHSRHEEQRVDAREDADGRKPEFAAVAVRHVVDDDHQQTEGELDHELSAAYGADALYHFEVGAQQVQKPDAQGSAPGEEIAEPHQRAGALGQHRAQGRAPDPEAELHNEEGVEEDVGDCAGHLGEHGVAGAAAGSHERRNAVTHEGQGASYQDDAKVVAAHWQQLFAGAGEQQQAPDAAEPEQRASQSGEGQQRYRVDEGLLGRAAFSGAAQDGHARGTSDCEQQRKGEHDDHGWEGERDGGDAVRSRAASYEDAVHDVVNSVCEHADGGRQREAQQQARHFFGIHIQICV